MASEGKLRTLPGRPADSTSKFTRRPPMPAQNHTRITAPRFGNSLKRANCRVGGS